MASNGTWKWVAVIVAVFGAVYLLTRKGAAALTRGIMSFAAPPTTGIEGGSLSVAVSVTNMTVQAGVPKPYAFKTRFTFYNSGGSAVITSPLQDLPLNPGETKTGSVITPGPMSWTFIIPAGTSGACTMQAMLLQGNGLDEVSHTTTAPVAVASAAVVPAGSVTWA